MTPAATLANLLTWQSAVLGVQRQWFEALYPAYSPKKIAAHSSFAYDEVSVGQSAEYAKQVTEEDIQLFAGVTGDTNPVHLDREYAQKTMFKGCIAHGMLTAAFISKVLGTQLPGPGAIYISQTLNFKRPVRPGDTVLTRVTVEEKLEKGRLRIVCVCLVNDTVVLDGMAVIALPQ